MAHGCPSNPCTICFPEWEEAKASFFDPALTARVTAAITESMRIPPQFLQPEAQTKMPAQIDSKTIRKLPVSPEETDARRLINFAISKEILLSILGSPADRWFQVLHDLPEDAQVRDVTWDPPRKAFIMMVHSLRFSSVPLGSVIPLLEQQWQIRTASTAK